MFSQNIPDFSIYAQLGQWAKSPFILDEFQAPWPTQLLHPLNRYQILQELQIQVLCEYLYYRNWVLLSNEAYYRELKHKLTWQ